MDLSTAQGPMAPETAVTAGTGLSRMTRAHVVLTSDSHATRGVSCVPLWQVEVRGTFFVADDRLLCDVGSR